MISKKKFVMAASGAVLAAGIAIAVTGVVARTAHAQGTSTFSIVGMSENAQGVATVQVSFTCATPGLEVIDVTAAQGVTATAGTGNITCTGSAQTATVILGALTGGMQFGTGQVQVGVTTRYDDRSSFPNTYTFSGTTTTLSYIDAATTNP